ncbi:MAG: EAL domain-containing protein [Minicystis sp.]
MTRELEETREALRASEERYAQLAQAVTSAEARRHHESSHDALTGQPNRVLFLDRVSRRIARETQGDRALLYAVLFIDVDRFKVINDSLGHPIGDQVLVTMAKKLRAAVGPGDTVARLSGDEFGVLLDEIPDVAEAVRVAERIRDALAEPAHILGHEVFTEVSLGIALSDPVPDSAEHLLRDADTAMHRAKRRRETRYEVFDPHMHAQALALTRIETDLRRAVSRAELVLHYQPIINLDTGCITGLEALIRWRHPERGLVGPVEFIGLAEETGLIVPIGSWVLREACRQVRDLAERAPGLAAMSLSVNLSGRQLVNAGIVAEVERARAEMARWGAHLHLEITETVLIENASVISARLHDLRALGVGLHIDDFGTGYSSLSVLQTFPIDTLKIDRSFVARLDEPGTSAAVVEAIITIAKSLDLRVVAEGIETAAQLALLRARGCHDGQGYFFSRPLDFEAVSALLAAAPRW